MGDTGLQVTNWWGQRDNKALSNYDEARQVWVLREPKSLSWLYSLCLFAFVDSLLEDRRQRNSSPSGSGTRRVVNDDDDD